MISETTLYRDWFCEPRSPLCSRSLSTFFTASLIAFISEISRRSEMFLWQAPASARRHHAAFFFCNTDRYRRLRPVFDASRSKGSGKSKKSPWYNLFHAARFFRCAYHFVSIAESSASSMVRCKPNNISLRQYLHDDLYTRHVLRPAVHGHELFHHRAGISGAWMATTLIGAVVNIVLDPVFIFLLHMNIAGAALATVLAQLSSCVFVLLTLKQKKMPIPLTLAPIRRSTAVRILKMGFSPFLILATDSVIIIALNAVLQHFGGPEYGDTLITCATIVQSYMLLITSPMLGITGGPSPSSASTWVPERLSASAKLYFASCFYASVLQRLCSCCPVLFRSILSEFSPKTGIRISFCLGHSGLYPRRYPAELPVCLCRCPDCHEPDKAVPVFIPAAEKRVFCSDLSASPLFRCKDVLLRGTHCRYALLLLFQSCLLPDL